MIHRKGARGHIKCRTAAIGRNGNRARHRDAAGGHQWHRAARRPRSVQCHGASRRRSGPQNQRGARQSADRRKRRDAHRRTAGGRGRNRQRPQCCTKPAAHADRCRCRAWSQRDRHSRDHAVCNDVAVDPTRHAKVPVCRIHAHQALPCLRQRRSCRNRYAAHLCRRIAQRILNRCRQVAPA